MIDLPLRGIRVVDVTTTVAGQLCGAILAHAGAEVVRADLAGSTSLAGTPYREDWQTYLDLDKVVESLDPSLADDAARIEELLAHARLFLTSAPLGVPPAPGLDADAVLARHANIVAACVTPFGDSGPYAGHAADDMIVSALSGLADATPGLPDRRARHGDPPLQSLAPLTESGGAILAAVAVLGALLPRADGSPPPRRVELAVLEAAVAQMVFEWGIYAYGGGVRGRRPVPADLEPNVYLPCRDGYVVLVGFTPPHWRGLVEMMGEPAWALAPEFADAVSRSERHKELHAHLRAWAATCDGREILEEAQARGIPCCCGLELRETVASEQATACGSIRHERSGAFPADPIVVDGERRRRAEGGGAAGQARVAGGEPHARDDGVRRHGRTSSTTSPAGPLAGVRVLDLSQIVAGPFAGQLLAALGADVVLVESAARPVSRGFGPFVAEPEHDASMMFNNVNRGKRSVTLDLATAESREVLEQLVAASDVVLENLSGRAARSLRLTYDELRAIREDIVVASVSGFGRRGPWADYVTLHSGVILLSGLASVTRDEDGEMRLAGAIYPDLLAGGYITLAIQQALATRARTGRGAAIEVSMLDVLLTSMGGLVPAAARGEEFAAHPGRFVPSAEPEGFVAVSEGDVDETAIRAMPKRDAMATLQGRGVRAGAVLDIREVIADPHLAERGFVLDDDHPVSGARPVAGVPWRYDGIRPTLRHAPRLGEHTDEVLTEVLGWEADRVGELRELQVLR